MHYVASARMAAPLDRRSLRLLALLALWLRPEKSTSDR